MLEENYDVKILMIDDDMEILEDIKRWLKRFGYKEDRMTLALSPSEVEEEYKDEHFDVIIIDMRMEGVDDSGFKFIKKHQELSSIIIIFTANDSVIDARKAFREYKVWDYLPKGIDIDDSNPFEVLHHSIQEGIRYKLKWGNIKDDNWVSEHLDDLISDYNGQYIAVMDGKVIESAESEDKLKELLSEHKRPAIMPVTLRVMA